ncbi:hypothetical protein [Alistipes sp.]|uniref:hypothetical protein n=1 Tax=Alistipes sp. TaxID=1872444 RepID=UPI003AF079D7
MRKLYLLLLLGALNAACIDRDYDLTEIHTDNITLGEEMRFPLATIRVTMQELRQGLLDVEEVFSEADDWLPSTLPGGVDYVDIVALNEHGTYLDALLDALIAEMQQPDGRKLSAVADRICAQYKYRFLAQLSLPSNVPDELFKSTFKTEFLRRQDVRESARQVARDYLGDIRIEQMTYKIDRVQVTNQVVKMLSDNLDPESVPAGQRTSTLHLYGEIRSKLPLSLTLEPVFSSTRLDFTVAVDAKKAVNPIAESDGTQLFREDLEQIISGVEVRIPITLERYYPALGFRPEEQEQIAIDLKLVKRGGLKLDIQ